MDSKWFCVCILPYDLPSAHNKFWPSRNPLLVAGSGRAPALLGHHGGIRVNQSCACWHISRKLALIFPMPTDRPSFPLIHTFILPVTTLNIKNSISSLCQPKKTGLCIREQYSAYEILDKDQLWAGECIKRSRELGRSQEIQLVITALAQLTWWAWTPGQILVFLPFVSEMQSCVKCSLVL